MIHRPRISHALLNLGFTAIAAIAGLAAVAADPEARAGAQALPGGHRTLADLLREAEEQATNKPASGHESGKTTAKPEASRDRKWGPDRTPPRAEPARPTGDIEPQPPPRPRAIPTPAPPPVVHTADLQHHIDARHRIVDACDFFDTLKRIAREEATLFQRGREHQQAVVVLTQAVANANMLNAPGTNQVPAAAKDAATRAVDRARASIRRTEQAVAGQQRVLKPLYERVAPHVGPWVQVYRDMAQFLVPRRSDPNRHNVLGVLEAAVARREDFFEGRVLAAFCHAYEGRADACGKHLDRAIGFIDANAPTLYATHVSHDCAATCIAANQPQRVSGFIKGVKKLPADNQSAFQKWLVAAHAVATKREHDAAIFFRRALSTAGFFEKSTTDKPTKPVNPILAGDAAHFFLTKKSTSDKEVADAANLVERAEVSDAWQLLRAKAALAARQARWDDAKAEIAACLAECPATLEAEVKSEDAAYRNKNIWRRNLGTMDQAATEAPEEPEPSGGPDESSE